MSEKISEIDSIQHIILFDHKAGKIIGSKNTIYEYHGCHYLQFDVSTLEKALPDYA